MWEKCCILIYQISNCTKSIPMVKEVFHVEFWLWIHVLSLCIIYFDNPVACFPWNSKVTTSLYHSSMLVPENSPNKFNSFVTHVISQSLSSLQKVILQHCDDHISYLPHLGLTHSFFSPCIFSFIKWMNSLK